MLFAKAPVPGLHRGVPACSTALALTIVLARPELQAQTRATICEEIEHTLFHPAEYIEEKVKREGISCFLSPDCCTPLWVANPLCYVIKRVKVSDAWTEIKKTWSCDDYTLSVEDALEAWLRNLVSPAPGFSIIPHDLLGLFSLYIGAAYEAADPLPDAVRDALKSAVKRELVPFSAADVDEARYLMADHPLARRIFPGGDVVGVTYYNLVIVTDRFLAGSPCDNVSNWAHELTHVHQYKQAGWTWFLNTYLAEGLVHEWGDIRYERQANGVESTVRQDCLSSFKRFRRGDANDDGRLDMSDAIEILKVLFLGGAFGCRDAADYDDNGALGVGDAIACLQHLFLNGAPPAPPARRCGPDLTLDALGCESSQSCLGFWTGI